METTFLAHASEDGRTQTVLEHLEHTAELSARFAGAFGAEAQGRLIGLAHDIGKCSDAFQKRLLGGAVVDHATAGALECAKRDQLWAASCVAGHHGGLQDVGNLRNDGADDPTLYGRLRKAIGGGIPDYLLPLELPSVPLQTGFGKDDLSDSFRIRMLFSCLIDADYLDTEAFMSGGAIDRGGSNSIPELLDRLNSFIAPWRNPDGELNRLRCRILNTCIEQGTRDKGIYTLTVPTGGGKTIASMAFALNHAVKHGMDRVIYVIPYTSIIEQTAAIFRNVFGAANVVEHHSGASFEIAANATPEQYRNIRATENWDAPIIVTTAVQFFESLYANRPSKCRKLHSIANSVIIFDEAQMLPTEQLLPCVAAISKLAEDCEATALLCTATQPVLNDLFARYAPRIAIEELCPNPSELFPCFRRVVFDRVDEIDADGLAGKLADLPQVLCIVNSRKSAQLLYKKLPAEGSFHLSTLMYPAHRRAVLADIRERLYRGLPCRVISTSLIEAGVDVDFPAVYREMTGLDSILQAAGRCNREGKRRPEESVVTIFSGLSVTPQMLQVNIGAAKAALSGGADPAALATVERYFKEYRSLAGTKLDKSDVVSSLEHGIQGRKLPFQTVAERFHLIDDNTKTLYIPLGEGAALVKRLLAGERSRSLFRALGQYSVNVYERQFGQLLDDGDLTAIDDDSAVLQDISKYDRFIGLILCDNKNTGLFI